MRRLLILAAAAAATGIMLLGAAPPASATDKISPGDCSLTGGLILPNRDDPTGPKQCTGGRNHGKEIDPTVESTVYAPEL